MTQLTGYLFALTSAFLWAVVAIPYKEIGRTVSPLGVNAGKSLVALLCMGGLLLCTGFESVSSATLFLLFLSGAFGIALGDTFFFISLNRLSPGKAVLMTTLIPVITVLLSLVFLKEHLSIRSLVGITSTISGIMIVLSKQSSEFNVSKVSVSGIIYSVLSSLCCAAGIIFSKLALYSTPALEAAFIRNLFGLVILICLSSAQLNPRALFRPFSEDTSLLGKLIMTAFFGAFLGTWLSILGLKFAPASIATVLNSTSPLFMIPLSFFILKEKILKREVVGTLIAVAGVGMILTGGIYGA